MYSLFTVKAEAAPRRIPFFSQAVKAGFPSPASDYVEAVLDFNDLLAADRATTFVLRAEGESMTGAAIFPGDYLVVDRALVARPEDVVIAALDGEFTVKRLRRRAGRFELAAENPSYPPVAVDESSELSIWGVVTYVIHGLIASGRPR